MKIKFRARCLRHRYNLVPQGTEIRLQRLSYLEGTWQLNISGFYCPVAAAMDNDQDKYHIGADGQVTETEDGEPKWVCQDTWMVFSQ